MCSVQSLVLVMFFSDMYIKCSCLESNGTWIMVPSATRKDPEYIFWYTLSLIWHPTLTTGVMPFLALSYMNLRIFMGIRKTRKVYCLYLDVFQQFLLNMFHCFLYEHLCNVNLEGIAIQYKKSVESCTVFISLLFMGDKKHKTDYRPYCKCV